MSSKPKIPQSRNSSQTDLSQTQKGSSDAKNTKVNRPCHSKQHTQPEKKYSSDKSKAQSSKGVPSNKIIQNKNQEQKSKYQAQQVPNNQGGINDQEHGLANRLSQKLRNHEKQQSSSKRSGRVAEMIGSSQKKRQSSKEIKPMIPIKKFVPVPAEMEEYQRKEDERINLEFLNFQVRQLQIQKIVQQEAENFETPQRVTQKSQNLNVIQNSNERINNMSQPSQNQQDSIKVTEQNNFNKVGQIDKQEFEKQFKKIEQQLNIAVSQSKMSNNPKMESQKKEDDVRDIESPKNQSRIDNSQNLVQYAPESPILEINIHQSHKKVGSIRRKNHEINDTPTSQASKQASAKKQYVEQSNTEGENPHFETPVKKQRYIKSLQSYMVNQRDKDVDFKKQPEIKNEDEINVISQSLNDLRQQIQQSVQKEKEGNFQQRKQSQDKEQISKSKKRSTSSLSYQRFRSSQSKIVKQGSVKKQQKSEGRIKVQHRKQLHQQENSKSSESMSKSSQPIGNKKGRKQQNNKSLQEVKRSKNMQKYIERRKKQKEEKQKARQIQIEIKQKKQRQQKQEQKKKQQQKQHQNAIEIKNREQYKKKQEERKSLQKNQFLSTSSKQLKKSQKSIKNRSSNITLDQSKIKKQKVSVNEKKNKSTTSLSNTHQKTTNSKTQKKTQNSKNKKDQSLQNNHQSLQQNIKSFSSNPGQQLQQQQHNEEQNDQKPQHPQRDNQKVEDAERNEGNQSDSGDQDQEGQQGDQDNQGDQGNQNHDDQEDHADNQSNQSNQHNQDNQDNQNNQNNQNNIERPDNRRKVKKDRRSKNIKKEDIKQIYFYIQVRNRKTGEIYRRQYNNIEQAHADIDKIKNQLEPYA